MKKYLLTGLAALAMFAYGCSDKTEDLNSQVDKAGNDNLTGYITLTLNQNTGSRTDDFEGREPGVGNENTISNVTVVLTDATGTVNTIIPGVAVTGNQTAAFKVNTGTYLVFALVNVPTGVSNVVKVNENINQVLTVADANAAHITAGFENGSFFMTNQRNASNVTGGVSVTVASTNLESNPAVATVSVDRVAVKIVDKTGTEDPVVPVSIDQKLQDAGIKAVDVIGFVPLNVNKQFNSIQQWSKNNENGTPSPLTVNEVLYTPTFSNVVGNYFFPVTNYTKIEATGITDLTKGQDIYVKKIYTTENRPPITRKETAPILTSGMGETTAVIFRVQAKSDASTNMCTFYAVNNVIYTSIDDVQALPQYVDETLPTTAPELRAKGIQVYEDGIMYYTYFVRSPNTKHKYDGENYYGVFRNSVYNLSVTKLAKLGDDVPGGTKVTPDDPNPPIDTDETYLKVTLVINDWVINTIPIEF